MSESLGGPLGPLKARQVKIVTRVVLTAMVAVGLASCERIEQPPQEDRTSDLRWRLPGVGRIDVWTDPATGCEYLIASWKEVDLEPRLTSDGKPMCGAK